MATSQQQFDGQNAVPGYTLFRGKGGNSYYLKGENLSDDEITSRVAKLRGDQPAVSDAAKQEGAYQKKPGGKIFNAGSASEREFVKNPSAADTFGNDQNQSFSDRVLQPQQGEGAALRGAKGVGRAVSGIVTTPINLVKPPQDSSEMAIAGGASSTPGAGSAILAAKRGLIDPAMSAGKKAAESFRNAKSAPTGYEAGLQRAAGILHGIDAAIPVIGPMAESAFSSAMSGDTAGAVTEGASNVAMLRKGAESAEKTGSKIQTKTGEVVNRPAPKESAVPGREAIKNTNKEVLQHAADEGIDLTPEQAKGEITGKQGMAEQARIGGEQLRQAVDANRAKLSDAINRFGDRIDPKRSGLSEESAGDTVRNTVQVAKDVTHDNASNAYKNLSWANSTPVETAQISNAWKGMKGQLPIGIEKQVMAQVPRNMRAQVAELMKPTGMKNPLTFEQAASLRSLFRDLGDTDGLPNRVQGAFRSMTKAVDTAMDGAATKAGFQSEWRAANQGWKDYVTKYGDRQSPLYRVLHQSDSAQITRRILNNASADDIVKLRDQTAMRDAKGNIVSDGPALEAIKRQALIDITNNKFGMKSGGLGGYSHSFLNTLFGPEATKELYLKGELARRMDFDVNPSRTAKTTLAAEQVINPLKPASTIGNIAKFAYSAKKNMPKNVNETYLNAPSSRYQLAPPLWAAGTLPQLQAQQRAGLLLPGSK